jgi:hypothetical protein
MDGIEQELDAKTNGVKLPRLALKKRLSAGNIGEVIDGVNMPQFGAIKSHNFLFS